MFDTVPGADPYEPITISALEFDVLWEHLGLGEHPLVLRVPSPGRTRDERAALVARVWNELGRRGLGRPVQVDDRLARMLRTLQRPDRELDGRMWLGRSVRMLVAATGDDAAMAVLTDNQLTLRPADTTGLPRHALSVLPSASAGPGQSVTLRTEDFEAAARQARVPKEFEAALRERGVRAEDAATMMTMVGDIVHQGQFGAAARDRFGHRVRADRVVSFFDTKEGRYVQIRRAEAGGPPWSTISPADHRRMLQHVTGLLAEVAGGR
jgi:ESX secretion-associated protein EspG